MTLHVAVAIVAYRNPADVVRCLAALANSTYADFEVVICENGGAAAFRALSEALPTTLAKGQPVRAIQAPGNLGYAGGVNLCLAATPDADAWWVLNPDTAPLPGALAALAERLSRGDCEAVGGPLFLPGGQIQSYGGRWRPWLARAESIGMGRRLDDPVDPASIERSQSYLNGASMLIGRRFLETVGTMREDYFLYCEEVEWCLRARAQGMRLGFAPTAQVLHEHGTATGAGTTITRRPRTPIYLSERNKMLLTRDRFGLRLPIAAAAALVLMLLKYAPVGAWRQWGYALRGWWAGLRGERGVPSWAATPGLET